MSSSSQHGVRSGINIQILQGDILSSTRDAIVVPVSNDFVSGELNHLYFCCVLIRDIPRVDPVKGTTVFHLVWFCLIDG